MAFQVSCPVRHFTLGPVAPRSLSPRTLSQPNSATFYIQPYASQSKSQSQREAKTPRTSHGKQKIPRPRGRPLILKEVLSAQRLRKEGKWSKAKQLLEEVSQQGQRDPNYKNEVLHVRAAQLRYTNPSMSPADIFEELYNTSESIPANSNATTFNAILLGLRDSRPIRQDDGEDASDCELAVALKVFDTMLEKHINPDHYTMSILFQMCAFSRSSRYLKIFEMRAKDDFHFRPNTVSGSALLSACAKCGQMESFERVLGDLHKRRTPLNERAYASIISAYHRIGLHAKVMGCYQAVMDSESVNPNIFIFSGTLASCCKARDAANARTVFQALVHSNTRPNEEILISVFETAVRTGDIQLGIDVLFEWGPRYRLCRVTLTHVSRLLYASKKSSASAEKTLESVKAIVNRMAEETNLKPDVTLLNSLVSTFIGLGSFTDARDVLDNWFPKFGQKPDVVTFNVLIHNLGRGNRTGQALQVWALMRKSGVKPDRVTLNSMLDALIQGGDLEEATKLNEEMKKVPGMETDVTRVLLELKMYRITKDAARAMEMFWKWVKQGNYLDSKTHGLLLTVLFEAKRDVDGISVFGWLLWKRLATAIVFNVVLDYIGRERRDVEMCLSIFQSMKSKGIAPDEITYSIIIRICSRGGQMDKAFRLLGEMQDVGLGLTDTYAWTALIDGCGRVGQWQRAVETLKGMREAKGSLALIPAPTTHCYNAAIYAGSMRGGGWKVAVEVYELLGADQDQEADVVTYSAMASSILCNRQEIQEWGIVQEVHDKLKELVVGNAGGVEGDRVQQRTSGSTRRLERGVRKKLVSKVKRIEWVLREANKGRADGGGGGELEGSEGGAGSEQEAGRGRGRGRE